MQNYKHIIVPLDLTPHSLKTLDAAHTLSKQHNSKISVIHILDPVPVLWVVHSSSDQVPDAISRVFGGEITPQENEKQVMEYLCKTCFIFDIDKENIHLCMGEVTDQILKMANKLSADLVVMGYHHEEHFSLFKFPTADQVLKRADCDVMIIGAHKDHDKMKMGNEN